MRFILNFIFYGILFYIIYLIFPDAFSTLVSWAGHLTELLKEFYLFLTAKFYEWYNQSGIRPTPQHALSFFTAIHCEF